MIIDLPGRPAGRRPATFFPPLLEAEFITHNLHMRTRTIFLLLCCAVLGAVLPRAGRAFVAQPLARSGGGGGHGGDGLPRARAVCRMQV